MQGCVGVFHLAGEIGVKLAKRGQLPFLGPLPVGQKVKGNCLLSTPAFMIYRLLMTKMNVF